jgi:hypothetical protein
VSASSPARKRAAKKGPTAAKRSAPAPAQEDGYSDELIAAVDLDGSPELVELHQLSRRQRAETMAQISTAMPRLVQLDAALKSGGGLDAGDLTQTAAILAIVADAEDILASAAVSKDEFYAWAAEADDLQLLALFAKFARSMSSGEASGSSS